MLLIIVAPLQGLCYVPASRRALPLAKRLCPFRAFPIRNYLKYNLQSEPSGLNIMCYLYKSKEIYVNR